MLRQINANVNGPELKAVTFDRTPDKRFMATVFDDGTFIVGCHPEHLSTITPSYPKFTNFPHGPINPEQVGTEGDWIEQILYYDDREWLLRRVADKTREDNWNRIVSAQKHFAEYLKMFE